MTEKVLPLLETSEKLSLESDSVFEARRQNQQEIVQQLPDDFMEQINSRLVEAEEFRKRIKERPLSPEEKTRQIRGAIFEILGDLEYKRKESRETPSTISTQLLEIFRNPPEILRQAIGIMLETQI